MSTATLTSKGQMTIPKDIREHLQLKTGDKLHFLIDAEGNVSVRPSIDARQLRGVGSQARRKTVSIEEMEAALVEAFKQDYSAGLEP